MEAPFAPSLFVDIRKRMGQSVFDSFHQAIIKAHDGEKEKIKSKSENQETLQANPQKEAKDCSSTVSEDNCIG